eukprot:TRINITY_DN1364_c3_g1_i1.p1 TRINITY_DN1364_c3_g1~~TRINITY_DN1364_c3_g1_i1.p1  ORF type:complete len:211 (+),score=49.06 TRINITY_DN1364_c3_g1_i1:58-690(+)
MALRLAICGTTTSRTGTEEAYWLIVFDGDNHGINMDARIKQTDGDGAALMFRDGMNTYVGVMEQSSGHNGPWPCRGLYYHNDDGGPSGHVPRGTFNLNAYRIEVGGKIVVFDGSYSDSAVSGMHCSFVVVFDDDRMPKNHKGSFEPDTNTLSVLHGTRLFVGKWALSNSNVDKWAGVFYNTTKENPTLADFNMQGCPSGTFLVYPSELEQ